ncbi:hypothetical protein [Paraburkholderia caribensis]|uniref:hypothetical protein n=1 Tax=Paraburkholderia caribensis TaxID=75105 RepID=UPI0034D1A9C8
MAPLDGDVTDALSDARSRAIVQGFFRCADGQLERDNPSLAARLRQGSLHWMRHAHESILLLRAPS